MDNDYEGFRWPVRIKKFRHNKLSHRTASDKKVSGSRIPLFSDWLTIRSGFDTNIQPQNRFDQMVIQTVTDIWNSHFSRPSIQAMARLYPIQFWQVCIRALLNIWLSSHPIETQPCIYQPPPLFNKLSGRHDCPTILKFIENVRAAYVSSKKTIVVFCQ
jgi:hypothetical protein